MRRKIFFAAIAVVTLVLLVFDGVLFWARYHTTQLQTAAVETPAEQATDKTAQETQAALARGKELDGQFKPTEARPYFQIAANHGSGEAWYYLGDYEKAVAAGYYGALYKLFEVSIERGDFVKAKSAAQQAKQHSIRIWESRPGEIDAILGACLNADQTGLSEAERKAITADERNDDSYTPNDEMKAAVAIANGWGVPRDRNRATALICRMQDLGGASRRDLLRPLTAPDKADEAFLFCDCVSSGRLGGACESHKQDRIRQTRDKKLAALTAGFTAEQKAAYDKLHQAAEAYIESHGSNELDLTGSLSGAFYADEVGHQQAQFVDALIAFEQGKLPPKDDFAEADKALNKTYNDLLKDTHPSEDSTVTPEGVRKTERLWLEYRDAWAVFGILRYPTTNAEDWKAWAARARIATLKIGFRPFE